jgi:AraC-like DNA-binding protein
MRLLQQYRSRKFFWRILFTNMLLVVLFLLFFCTVVFVYSRNTTLTLQQDANQKVLGQINYNIDHLNEMAKTLAISYFYDRDLTPLMKSDDMDMFEFYNKLNKLDHITFSNLFVHSIVIYNANNECTYSTSANNPVMCNPQEESSLHKYLREHPDVPKLTFLPYMDLEGGRERQVFAYMMYESIGGYTGRESVMMIAVKPEWLFDNIRTVNELADNSLGSMFLMDKDGHFIDSAQYSLPAGTNREEILDKLRASTNNSGYFITNNSEGKQIVTYMASEANQWKVISIQPYDQVFGKINKIGVFSLLVLLGFIVLSFFVSILFSLRVYKPMGRLVNQLKLLPARDTGLSGNDKDELNFLSTVYANMQKSMLQLRESSSANQHVLAQYFIRQWITDSTNISEQQIKQYTDDQLWVAEKTFMLCLLKIDDYAAFRNQRSEAERKLCRFAIGNILEEWMGEHFKIQVVDLMEDHLVLLIQLADTADESNRDMEFTFVAQRLRRAQEIILNYYHLSLTAIWSEPISDYRAVTAHYQQALIHAQLRMIIGKMSIITPQLYIDHARKQVDEKMTAELYRRLAESIKSHQLELMSQRLEEVIRHTSSYHCEDVDEAIMQLIMLINHTLRELNPHKVQSLTAHLKSFTRQILEQETLTDVQQLVLQMLREMTIEQDAGKSGKTEFLIGAVKEMVDLNYMDPNLSLKSIADVLKLSPGYLGRYFRSKESLSVADYINEVRLHHSLSLLEQTDDSIVEIMRKVGFNNESNFFKLFKKKIGTTPNEYRLARS